MPPTETSAEHVWELIEDIRMSLLVTKTGDAIDARPMAAISRSEEGCIYILANKRKTLTDR